LTTAILDLDALWLVVIQYSQAVAVAEQTLTVADVAGVVGVPAA
jgi:hypothetical protein